MTEEPALTSILGLMLSLHICRERYWWPLSHVSSGYRVLFHVDKTAGV